MTAALFDDAMADNSPLFKTITKYLDDQMLADIAKAYDAGRLLLIASTDLDAQQPVIWNIGAIAKSGHPKGPDTIRRILLASAAIPGAFSAHLLPAGHPVGVGKDPYERPEAADAKGHRRLAGGEHLAVLRTDRAALWVARA